MHRRAADEWYAGERFQAATGLSNPSERLGRCTRRQIQVGAAPVTAIVLSLSLLTNWGKDCSVQAIAPAAAVTAAANSRMSCSC